MKSLRHQAYDQIYDWILSGKLPKGHATSEIQLSNMLDMSRTPVRAALQQLEQEGFIKIAPKHGIIVLDSSAQRVSDLLDMLISFLLFSVHSVSLSKQRLLLEFAENKLQQFEQLLEHAHHDLNALISFEYDSLHDLIQLCHNEEMTKLFRQTMARLFWATNKTRWKAPYHIETTEIFNYFLKALKNSRTFHEAAFLYLQNLKNTWT